MRLRPIGFIALAAMLLMTHESLAQTPSTDQTPSSTQAPSSATPAPAPAAPAATPAEQQFKPAEIEAIVAPIALFPDSLLSLVLMAATYPLEVVQADRWLKSSKLKGDELKAAVDKQP